MILPGGMMFTLPAVDTIDLIMLSQVKVALIGV